MLIKDFFKDQEIFITGGSGFLGKALIEKLLRSCSGFSKIYVLIRTRKGKSAEERLQDVLKNPLFDRAREEQPDAFKKLVPISGDCSEIGLGLQEEDLKKLAKVTIIYHSAASVRFDDPLRDAVLLNTRGTWELLKIAEKLKKLQVFVHVSTAYCNTENPIIEEKVYEPFVSWREAIKVAENMVEEMLDIFTPKYTDFKPNTYTFTKSLSEQLVYDYRHTVPVQIYRPAIVTHTLFDPIPGWMDNFNGPIGMLTACGLGILRSHHSDGTALLVIVPVDIVIRGLIICAYKKGIENTTKSLKSKDSVDVFNCTVDSVSPVMTKDFVEGGRLMILHNPFEKTVWLPGGVFTRCGFLFAIRVFVLHILLALVVDTLLRLSGQKPMLLKINRRINDGARAVSYFVRNNWTFPVQNFFGLDRLVPQEELEEFAFVEKASFDHMEYVTDGIRGAKKFLLKENSESSPAAKKRLRFLKGLDFVAVSLWYSLYAWIFYTFVLKKLVQYFGY